MPLPPSLHYLRALLFRNLPSFRSVRFFAYGVANIFCLWHFISQYVGNYPLTWGPSMLPTLAARGDIVWVSSYYRHGRGIEVGDVVSFKHPCVPEAAAVKRVAGMPGDFVMRDVYEGGGGKGMGMMLQVPEGHCWVLGDNLTESRDSRTYGPLPLGLINGKVLAKRWPGGGFEWLDNGLKRPEAGS